jgi:hypothetical protein
MINTLYNMFPLKFGSNYQVCGSHMSALGKKRTFGLELGGS